MTIELYHCAPMDARISKKQCEFNRTQKDDHRTGKLVDSRCKGCAGLGEAVNIKVEEVAEMASKKGTCLSCKKKDITLPARGLCSVCYQASREAAGTAKPKVVSKPAPKTRADVQEKMKKAMAKTASVEPESDGVSISLKTCDEVVAEIMADVTGCAECGKSPCVCVVATDPADDAVGNRDFHAYLRELAHNKVEEWISDLYTARNPLEFANRYADMCNALEGLGY